MQHRKVQKRAQGRNDSIQKKTVMGKAGLDWRDAPMSKQCIASTRMCSCRLPNVHDTLMMSIKV